MGEWEEAIDVKGIFDVCLYRLLETSDAGGRDDIPSLQASSIRCKH